MNPFISLMQDFNLCSSGNVSYHFMMVYFLNNTSLPNSLPLIHFFTCSSSCKPFSLTDAKPPRPLVLMRSSSTLAQKHDSPQDPVGILEHAQAIFEWTCNVLAYPYPYKLSCLCSSRVDSSWQCLGAHQRGSTLFQVLPIFSCALKCIWEFILYWSS